MSFTHIQWIAKVLMQLLFSIYIITIDQHKVGNNCEVEGKCFLHFFTNEYLKYVAYNCIYLD